MAEYFECITYLLAKAYQKSQNQLKQQLVPYGLTSVQFLVLGALFKCEGATAGEIGKMLALDNATTSGVLDRLSDSGWISKKIDDEDRRIIRSYLSDKAKENILMLDEVRQKANEETLKRFTLEERVILTRLLRDFL